LNIRNYPGVPNPLGATWDGEGVNFALFAENAAGVELPLFDKRMGETQSATIKITERAHQMYHAYLPGIRSGLLYRYRVHRPCDPESGHRYVLFNAHHEHLDYTLPAAKYGRQWINHPDAFTGTFEPQDIFKPGDVIKVEGRSIILLLNPKA